MDSNKPNNASPSTIECFSATTKKHKNEELDAISYAAVEEVPGRAKRQRVTKKPKDAPMRPLSAYNIFFKEHRHEWLREMDTTNDIRQPRRFEAVGKAMGTRWKALTASQRQPYESQAARDQERYRLEKAEYKDKKARESTQAAVCLARQCLGGQSPEVDPPPKDDADHGATPLIASTTASSLPAASIARLTGTIDAPSSSGVVGVAPTPATASDHLGPLDTDQQFMSLQLQHQILDQVQSALAQLIAEGTSNPGPPLPTQQVCVSTPKIEAATGASRTTLLQSTDASAATFSPITPVMISTLQHPFQYVPALLQQQNSSQELDWLQEQQRHQVRDQPFLQFEAHPSVSMLIDQAAAPGLIPINAPMHPSSTRQTTTTTLPPLVDSIRYSRNGSTEQQVTGAVPTVAPVSTVALTPQQQLFLATSAVILQLQQHSHCTGGRFQSSSS